MTLHWSTAPFAALYDAIAKNDSQLKQTLANRLYDDLLSLLAIPEKSESSKKNLESGVLNFSDGSVFKVNSSFIENAIKLSDSLNIDEMIAAEILYFSSSNELNTLGTSYLDSAIAAYYNRRDFILQIVCYYLCSDDNDENVEFENNNSFALTLNNKTSLFKEISKIKNYSIDNILKSLKTIEKESALIKESVERNKLLGIYNENSPESKTINFRRGMLFKQYQLLGEILFGYVSKFFKNDKIFTVENFFQILDHVSSFKPEDMFAICYIPSLVVYVSNLDQLDDNSIDILHKKLVAYVDDLETLSETPLKAFIFLVFLTYFIEWCKQAPARITKYEFSVCVEEPMQKCVSVGALEQLLSISADTSLITQSNDNSIKPFYDFRTFLQQHIPRYIPIRLFDIDDEATLKLKNSLQQQKLAGIEVSGSEYSPIYLIPYEYQLSDHFTSFLVSVLSSFIHQFISTAAFMMTQLRDQEEDLLLSSDEFNLELLTENADLERLYMSMYYLYSNREQYSSVFWADTNSASYGFLQWASRCNSPLIMSTFSMVLAALASGDENAINVFSFLQMTNSNNYDSHTAPIANSTLLTKYSSVSWSTIYSTLSYYNDALSKASESLLENLTNGSVNLDLKTKNHVVTELGEDSIIYLSGFFQVLSQVAINSPKARTELLESDNNQLFTILENLLNMNTLLNGSIMTLLASLVGNSYKERCKFWQVLDNWIFRNGKNVSLVNLPVERFSKRLTDYRSIFGFINLVTQLLSPLDTAGDIFEPLSLTFPFDLGSMVRKPGIWCYIEYLYTKVLPEVDYLAISEKEKLMLKSSILNIMEICLSQLDPDLVLNASACHVKDMDSIVTNKSIILFLQAHPGSATMNFAYNNKVHDSLFKICSLGIDRINELNDDAHYINLLKHCLKVIDLILIREKFYSDELIHILRLPDNTFANPTNIGMCGLKSFYESFLLNLPLVANITLYVGSNKIEIANISLSIVRAIASSKFFANINNGTQFNLLKKNCLLAMYETIDESIRIRSAFIEQFDSPVTSTKSMAIKISILQFLNSNISSDDKSFTISHFLLGFDTTKKNFGSSEIDTTILSSRSLLKAIINISKELIVSMSNSKNIEYSEIKICALCLEILLKLCKSSLIGNKMLKYLRVSGDFLLSESSTNFILFLLENTHSLNKTILFAGLPFDGQISMQNNFASTGEGMCSLNAFVSYRNSLIQLIAMEVHESAINGSLSLNNKYLETLTHSFAFASGSSKLMNLLDILDFKIQNNIEKPDKLFSGFNFDYILRNIVLTEEPSSRSFDFPYDFSLLDKMVSLYAKDSQKVLSSVQRKDSLALFKLEKEKLKKIITCSLSYDNYKLLVFRYLKAWTLLIQVIITEVDMKLNKRSNFILEVFQNIIPKIDDYLEVDPSLAEDLVSLCVHLLYTYTNDREKSYTKPGEMQAKAALDFERLFPIFKVSLHGVLMPTSSPLLRSDLYILANNYLKLTVSNHEVISDLIIFIKSLDDKVFDIICHDSLVGEGSSRITAVILLESFVKVALQLQNAQFKENLIFDTCCKGNYIILLVQKLKLADECFLRALNADSKSITLDELLYELTSFKTSISLLLRISQTRQGAQQLLRSDIFGVLADCKFLQLDADLGFELNLKESTINGENLTTMTVSLDEPLGLNINSERIQQEKTGFNTSKDRISYYEIFIPIFQLITAIVISLGPQNRSCITQAFSIQSHFSKLIAAVLKRELIYEKHLAKKSEYSSNIENGAFSHYNVKGLRELTKLFTLLDSLIDQ